MISNKLNNALQVLKNNSQYKRVKRELLQVLSVLSLGLFPLFSLFFLAGCNSLQRVFTPPTFQQQFTAVANDVQHASQELAILSWIGGIATLAGIGALVITRGQFGMRAILIGVALVLINFAVANYLSWVLIPVLVGTGCVSLAWSYVTIKQMIQKKQECK